MYWKPEGTTAVVDNERRIKISFTGIDHCPEIQLTRADGRDDNRCDGMLYYGDTVIFVELKDRNMLSSKKWLDKADKQLLPTIQAFEQTDHADDFSTKRAYIANKSRPFFTTGQLERIARFNRETNGYILYIQNRIEV